GSAPRFTADDIRKYEDGSSPWTHPNTDWYEEVIKPLSMQNSANVSLSGGSETVKYFVSVGKLSEDGYYKNSATRYNQYNLRTNIDAKVTDFLTMSLDVSGRQENRNFPARDAGSIFRSLIKGKPNLPAYWPNGLPGPDIENGNNPAVTSTEATGYTLDNKYVFQSNLGATIKIPGVEGLSFVGNLSVDQEFRPSKTWRTPWYLYTWDYSTYVNGEPDLVPGKRGVSTPELTESFFTESLITSNFRANYTKELDNHSFGFMIGTERQTENGKYFSAYRNDYVSTAIDQLYAGGNNASKTNDGSAYATARLNYFGRINYVYSEKYMVEMVWRYDGSQIFDEASRYGFFPGISAGWLVSEESFLQGASFINRLKLRGSYGTLGNDRISPYQYLATFGFGGDYIFGLNNETKSIRPTSVPNQGVSWEVAKNANFGIDATLFDGKINLELDVFSNLRTDILLPRAGSVPLTAGFSPPDENIGKVSNKGIDFKVDYLGGSGDFKYNIGLNGGYAKNKILFWDEAPGNEAWQVSTGRPIGAGLFYDAMGVFETQADVDAYPHWDGARAGDIIFRDVNDDGKIDTQDRIRVDENNFPRFVAGATFGFQYKSFDLSILLQGSTGARQYLRTQSGEFGNYLVDDAEGRWTTANPSSTKPRAFNRTDEYWMARNNTYFYRSTDYVRLKNVRLGYTFPTALVEKAKLKGAEIYTNGVNLITLDKFKVLDPEGENNIGAFYPQKKVFNLGVNLTF
ncbi:MAG: SusC/RagA family TonB-linked outer membrane protein, partial [Cyclobacteriaceae bacterium]|nr:SusC/RagA family TonB-linked outer membrane protein [Cyclobacteriaceae bacterium]